MSKILRKINDIYWNEHNVIATTEILAMAHPRSEVIRIVRSLSRFINDHLVKIYLGGKNNPNFNHWIGSEVIPALLKIRKTLCKNDHKCLDGKTIKTILLKDDLDNPENLKGIEYYNSLAENLNQKNESANELWKRFENLYNDLVKILGKENPKDTDKEQLRKIITKHLI